MQEANESRAYSYDMYGRLGSITDYDWVGNRNPATWGYNDADQLTATPNNQYTYLMTGGLMEQYNSSGTTLQKEYTYTYANLLSSVTHDDVSGAPQSLMTWDADSNRVSFTSSTGGMTRFVYDPTAGIPAVIEEVLPSTSSAYYIREPNGALIARIAGSNTSYYHFDALGSTKLLTDGSGTVTDSYSYDAWGSITGHSGVTSQPYQYVGQLGYCTHYQDTNLPMLQLGVRFYDPELGRFTQVDRIRRPSESPYAYSRNAPATAVDPWGLQSTWSGLPDPKPQYDMQCKMRSCAYEMADAAYRESEQSGLPGANGGPQDALRHCIWSCKMQVHCPGCTSPLAGTWHEYRNPGPGRHMDLGNNKKGRQCGSSIKGGNSQSCLECCLASELDWWE
jgi:RHS repeat-associated protein